MKSVISYGLDKCIKCLKCVKSCPTGAISQRDGRISIDDAFCINCGRCIRECYHQGLQVQGAPLSKIADFAYTVCLVPSAFANNFSSNKEIEEMFYAIKDVGFDEVVDLSPYEGRILKGYEDIAASSKTLKIASFCPVVNNLIKVNYQTLEDNLIPYQYASEIAARQVRERLSDKENVGIFLLAECEAKLSLAKYPSGGNYEVDCAVAIADALPVIKMCNKEKIRMPLNLSSHGLSLANAQTLERKENVLIADGFEKINSSLELAEFDLLEDINLMMLYPCFNGCIGGHLVWGNSFLTVRNYRKLDLSDEVMDIDETLLSHSYEPEDENEITDFKDRLRFFKVVNEVLEKLPGYDCSACGLQTCRRMAEEICAGHKTLEDCRIHRALEVKGENK